MFNKKGFTMVEILTVLVLLSIIIILVVPAITSSTDKAKQKIYDTKIKFLEDASYLYAQDNYAAIIKCQDLETGEPLSNCTTLNGSNPNIISYTITAATLVPEYYKPDNEGSTNMIDDPRNSSQYLDATEFEIIINKDTRKITAKIIKENS